MSRYTVTNLRAVIDDANGKYPLDEPNGYGNFNRFNIYKAYGKYCIVEQRPHSTGHREITHHGSAREVAAEFTEYLIENF